MFINIFLSGCFNSNTDQKVNFNDTQSYSMDNASSNSYVSWHGCDKLEADLNTFKILNSIYAKDKDYVYYYNYNFVYAPSQCAPIHKMKLNDNFTIINNEYAKDSKNVYKNGEILNLNPNSAEMVNDFTIKDKDTVYIHGEKTDLNPNSIEFINSSFVKDDKSVYIICDKGFKIVSYVINELEGVDPDNFIIEDDFIRAKSSVYIFKFESSPSACSPNTHKIENISASSFKRINSELYSNTNNLFFYDGFEIIRIPGVDAESI